MKTEASWWIAALAGVALMSWLGLQTFAWSDYDTEVSGAVRLLIAGDLGGFLAAVPAYGGSLVLRAPLAAATAVLGGGEHAVFRAMSIPCLMAVALLALMIVRRMRQRGRTTGVRILVLCLCVVNPITLRALEIGHPEELLCAALAIGALLAAIDGRTVLAAVLLGLAIATKSWAVLAIGPVLLALPSRRVLALALAAGVTVAVLLPVLLAGTPTALAKGVSTTGTTFNPWHLFWFLGDTGHVVYSVHGVPKADGWRTAPEWLSPLTHPLIAFLVVPLSLAWTRVHGALSRAGAEHLLMLLALLFFLRCLLDPWNNVYYSLPFVLTLVTWEGLCRRDRPPVVALLSTVLVWVTFVRAPEWMGPDMQSVVFLAWALPLAAWMARTAFAPAPAPAAAPAASRATPDPRAPLAGALAQRE